MKKNNIIIYPCDNTKCLPVSKCNCLSQGTCLIAPVSLHYVCENSYLLVIVEVFKDNKLYARRMKKVFTGVCDKNPPNHPCNNSPNCNHSPNCAPNPDCNPHNSNIIENFFAGDFKFYFLNDCNPKCIHLEVCAQYIYDC